MGLIQNKVTVSQPNSHVIVKNAGGLRGLTGPQGIPGPQGEPGEAATVTAGTTTTLPAGSDATVQNVGSTSDAIFNFGIPRGEKGETGETGAAATIEVGSTTTLPTGQDATVTNSGTSSAAVFDFGIPRGPQGEEGPQGFSPSASVSKTGDTATITITDKDGTTTAQITDGVTPTVDDALSPTSENPVQNKVVTNALAGKQPSFEIVDELPAEGVEGSEYLVDKAYETITELQGDTKQNTISGAQLLTKQGMATPTSDTAFWNVSGSITQTALDDGWATFTKTSVQFGNLFIRAAGYNCQPSTTYTVIIETKNSTYPSGSMTFVQKDNVTDPVGTFTIVAGCNSSSDKSVSMLLSSAPQYNVYTMTTKSEITEYGIRQFLNANNQAKSIDLRTTVLLGDHSSDWQNYVGDNWKPYVGGVASPNPDYPQEVQTVTGLQTIKVMDGIQIEKGSEATLYVPYTTQTYEVNLGKNILDNIGVTETKAGGITFTVNADKSVTVSGVATSVCWFKLSEGLQLDGDYFLSGCPSGGGTTKFSLQTSFSGTVSGDYGSGVQLHAGTTDPVWIVVRSGQDFSTPATFYPQIEKGTSKSSYAPYFTPIELCKIGDYQDYIYKSGEDWFVHKSIGEVDLDGTTEGTWTYLSDTGHERFVVNYSDIALQSPYASSTPKIQFSDYFEGSNGYHTYTGDMDNIISGHHNNHQIIIRATQFTSLAAFTSWLGTNKPSTYYVKATPTDTQITNADLIAQLEAINAVAIKHYNTLAVSSPNLPASLVLVQGANSHLEPYVYYNGKFEKVQIV